MRRRPPLAALPAWEMSFYWLVSLGSHFYSFYELHNFSKGDRPGKEEKGSGLTLHCRAKTHALRHPSGRFWRNVQGCPTDSRCYRRAPVPVDMKSHKEMRLLRFAPDGWIVGRFDRLGHTC
ncbi:protein-cysteine N-palmitoyltransferase HHAT [Arapaima gigas]